MKDRFEKQKVTQPRQTVTSFEGKPRDSGQIGTCTNKEFPDQVEVAAASRNGDCVPSLATALETPATQDDMAMQLEAAGKMIVQLKKETKSKDGRIKKLESENANLTADLEVLKCKQTEWTSFMYKHKNGAAARTLIEDMPLPMQQSLQRSFQKLRQSTN